LYENLIFHKFLHSIKLNSLSYTDLPFRWAQLISIWKKFNRNFSKPLSPDDFLPNEYSAFRIIHFSVTFINFAVLLFYCRLQMIQNSLINIPVQPCHAVLQILKCIDYTFRLEGLQRVSVKSVLNRLRQDEEVSTFPFTSPLASWYDKCLLFTNEFTSDCFKNRY